MGEQEAADGGTGMQNDRHCPEHGHHPSIQMF
jgi:hypothetical protein